MCGIAGFVTVQPSGSPSIVERMTDTIRHRGPDDSGYYRDPWASLGFRRLAIIDVAGGHQPMANEDASLFIVFNGEIFNHASLRPALEQAGHRYTSRSDTHQPPPTTTRTTLPMSAPPAWVFFSFFPSGTRTPANSSVPAIASARS